jgi:hypothetical protein
MFNGLIWIYVAVPLVAGATFGSVCVILSWIADRFSQRDPTPKRTVALRCLTAAVVVDIASLLLQWALDAAYRTGSKVLGFEASQILIAVASSFSLLLVLSCLYFVWNDSKPARYTTLAGGLILLITDAVCAVLVMRV